MATNKFKNSKASGVNMAKNQNLPTENDAFKTTQEFNKNTEEEVIYDLVLKNKNTSTNDELQLTEALLEQVQKLCEQYESVNEKLEQSLISSDALNKQLEQSKKTPPNHTALAIACTALLISVGTVFTVFDMQRDVTDFKTLLNSLTKQEVLEKKQTTLKIQELNKKIIQLSERVDKVFTIDNMDNVLQITRELRKQVNELANKKLSSLHSNHAPNQAREIILPSLKLTDEQIKAAQQLSNP